MTSNQIKFDATPLDKFRGNSKEYLDYLNKIFLISDIDVKQDFDYVKQFLRIQSNSTISLFFDTYKDTESWSKKAVEEFCNSLLSEVPNRPVNELMNLARAKKQKHENIKTYAMRLKSLLSFMSNNEKEQVILYKIVCEADDSLRSCLSEVSNFTFTEVIAAVDEYFTINEFKRSLVPSESRNDSSFKSSTYPSKFRREDKSVLQSVSSDKVKDRVNNTDSSELMIKTDSIKHSPEAGNSTISWGNRNLQSKKTLVDENLSYSPLVYEAIRIFGRDVVVMLDSGATCNILALQEVQKHNWRFHRENFEVKGVNNTSSNFIGFLDVNVSKIELTKNVTCRFYVSSCNESSISGGLCQELDISVDGKLEEARNRKESFIAQLNELNESQPHIVSYLLSHPKIFDDSILQPVLITSIPLSSTPERKLFRSYRPKDEKLKYLAKTLRKEIVEGKIRQEFDPYLTSPTHVINESKPRLVIDAKQVNKHIQDIYLPLLSHQDMQDRIAGAKRFYRFDFTAAFKSIALEESDKYIFGFSTTFGSYVSNVLNFGYSCSAQLFQQKMEQLFQIYNIQNYLLYIDDTLLFGDDHSLESNVLKFLQMCNDYNLKINLSKSEWNCPAVTFMGFKIDCEGIHVQEDRKIELELLRAPTNKTEAKSVLGKFSYVGRHIKEFSQITASLHPSAAEEYTLNERRQADWNKLQVAIRDFLVMHHPPRNSTIIFEALPTHDSIHGHAYFFDNSNNKNKLNNKKLVSVFMRKMNKAEYNYSPAEKELLTLGSLIEHERRFIISRKVVLLTRSPFVFTILTSPFESVLDQSSRLQKLAATILIENLEIIKETSPHKCEQSLTKLVSNSTKIVLPKQTPSTVSEFDVDEIVKFQSTDATCHLLKEFLNGSLKDINKIDAPFIKDLDALHFDGPLICFERRPVVNLSLVEKAVKIIHFATHAGTTDIRRKIKSSVYCHNISSVVDRIVGSCHSCLTMRKLPNKLYVSWVTAAHPRQIGSFDLCYIDNSTVIVLVDHFSNYIYAQDLPDKSSQSLINFFSPIMDEYPFVILISDGEPALTSNALSEFFSSYEICFHNDSQPSNSQKITSVKYRPESNGRIEGRISSLKKKLKKAALLNISPSQRLQWAANALNTSLSRTKNTNGEVQFLSPAEKYYLNCAVLPVKLPTFEECVPSPKDIYFKPRGTASEKFERGKLLGTYGRQVSLVEDEDGMTHLISSNYVFEGTPSPLYAPYTLADSVLLNKTEPVLQIPESPLTTPPSSPPDYQHALDESLERHVHELSDVMNNMSFEIPVDNTSLNENHVEIDYEQQIELKSLQPSIKSEIDLLTLLKQNPDCSFAVIDGSASNSKNIQECLMVGHGVGIVGCYNKSPLLISRRSFAVGRSTAPRMETYALLFALKIAQHLNVKKLIVITDCDYVSNTYSNEWYKNWFDERENFPHSSLWKQISDLKSPSYWVYHCIRDAFPLHSFVDKVAKGQFELESLNSEIFNPLREIGITLPSHDNTEEFLRLLK
uniref:Reverse transcriptase domain-containing protein n=2 Tax=Strongyloides papillosus TaxID=174720 RepID=A0A0N5C3I2_STREA